MECEASWVFISKKIHQNKSDKHSFVSRSVLAHIHCISCSSVVKHIREQSIHLLAIYAVFVVLRTCVTVLGRFHASKHLSIAP